MKKYKTLKIFFALLFLSVIGLSTSELQAQVRAGASFLKLNPGIRHHGMGFANTGSIDDLHALFTNPAATAFIRDWEWVTSYSKWFADTGMFSFVFGNNVPPALDHKTKFALGIHYMDYGTFNSTYSDDMSSVSAGDVLFSLSLARPVSFVSPDFSLGANVKYFNSRLEDVSASQMIFDVGLLYQFPRVHDFIFSAGASATQLGQPLNYLSVDTPLPRATRFGVSANYHPKGSNLFFQLNTDYVQTKDEIDAINVGGELNYNNVFYLRTGYQFNDNLLSRLTFGAGFRFHAGKKSDMRVDAAVLEGNEIFSPPLQAGLHHFSVGPDPFSIYPTPDSTYFPADEITFRWDDSRNRDLFEAFDYFIILARDERRGFIDSLRTASDVRHMLDQANSNENIFVLSFDSDEDLIQRRFQYSINHSLFPDTLNYALGQYEWTVVAGDESRNYKAAENSERFGIYPVNCTLILRKSYFHH